jgi:prolyl-tRNA synthetase
MGGSASEEFMVPAEVGEEEIAQCAHCGYVANREKATCKDDDIDYTDSGKLSLIETPDVKTISDLQNFLQMKPHYFIKSLLYSVDPGAGDSKNTKDTKGASKKFIMALIRGDLDVNETKLRNYLGVSEIEKAEYDEVKDKLGIPLGFAGPIGLDGVTIVADQSVKGIRGGVTGANKVNYHYRNVHSERDFNPKDYTDIRLVSEGDLCPNCEERVRIFKGIELGHIFKLGDKYTRAFSVSYLDEDGQTKVPLMGCYGIGVERTVAAVIEQNHDENGIVWPLSIAPFHLHLLPIKYGGKTKEICDELYRQLSDEGFEVLLDDRDLRPGVKFKDADLIGIPFRVTVGDRGLENNSVELVRRKGGTREQVSVDSIVSIVRKNISTEMNSFLDIEFN